MQGLIAFKNYTWQLDITSLFLQMNMIIAPIGNCTEINEMSKTVTQCNKMLFYYIIWQIRWNSSQNVIILKKNKLKQRQCDISMCVFVDWTEKYEQIFNCWAEKNHNSNFDSKNINIENRSQSRLLCYFWCTPIWSIAFLIRFHLLWVTILVIITPKFNAHLLVHKP